MPSKKPGLDNNFDNRMGQRERDRNIQRTEDVARENLAQTSNGNRVNPADNKGSDAQHGQTGIEKAKNRQPPDATRPFEDELD